MTRAKVELGRRLFYDPRLSGNGRQSCSSCHQQDKAFTDGRARAVGSTGELHPRSALSLANVAYNATLAWANPSLVTIEKQMEVPLFGERPVEMGITDANRATVIRRLVRDPRYRTMFAAAFPRQAKPVDLTNVIKAIASFQRTMISGDSRYDRHLAGKDAASAAREIAGQEPVLRREGRVQPLPHQLQLQRPDGLRGQAGRGHPLPQHGPVQRRRHRRVPEPQHRRLRADRGGPRHGQRSARPRCATSPSRRPTCTTARSRRSRRSCASTPTGGRNITSGPERRRRPPQPAQERPDRPGSPSPPGSAPTSSPS